ncbi:P-type conjugative transfer protein VirB9 [Sulfuriferula sp.]|uniref:P-type conjugative transfer protein VirB9 n=1 Tax=Sulfuriferula sp. TaxID=2025307 RepID=UPI00273028DB|nr:P-type conjugative transfer protein VirB9 [Sulfuriferula sp.]MDP2027875.1 P-type conjugative transfer protein VirB9 [Sulfuriferula sp.]
MKRLILIALLVPSLAFAELTPKQGAFDPRVRVVDYNPLNVVKLSTFYGVSTHVQFAEGENIIDVAVGDDQAWKIVPRGNHLFIKPQATKADTNVTVVTDKRTYQFALVVQPRRVSDSTAWSDPNLIFSLSFRYPDEEATQLARSENKEAVKTRLNEVKTKLTDATKAGQNFDYWVAGSEEISPTAARDDGRFIYLTFSNNRDMPAVYSVDAKGNEALINTNVIEGNTIVIQRLVPSLILRKGAAVASVVNKSFDLNGGIDNTTGTVASDVERVVKGAK